MWVSPQAYRKAAGGRGAGPAPRRATGFHGRCSRGVWWRVVACSAHSLIHTMSLPDSPPDLNLACRTVPLHLTWPSKLQCVRTVSRCHCSTSPAGCSSTWPRRISSLSRWTSRAASTRCLNLRCCTETSQTPLRPFVAWSNYAPVGHRHWVYTVLGRPASMPHLLPDQVCHLQLDASVSVSGVAVAAALARGDAGR